MSTQRVYSVSQRFYWHQHPFFELGIVLSGEADWRLGKAVRKTLKTGDAILVKPETMHCEEIQPNQRAIFAWLGFEAIGAALPPPAWAHRVISLANDFNEVSATFRTIAQEYHWSDALSLLRLEVALRSILLLTARHAERPRRVLQDRQAVSALNARQVACVEAAAHYFSNNLRDSMSVAQVAAYHSLGSAHFSKLFRRHYGVPPQTFLGNARLRKARELLANRELPVKEIAERCGFVDSAHFCKVFKEATGVTPKQFRSDLPERNGSGAFASSGDS